MSESDLVRHSHHRETALRLASQFNNLASDCLRGISNLGEPPEIVNEILVMNDL